MNSARLAFFSVGITAFIVDRLTKEAVFHWLPYSESVPIIPYVLYFTHIHNTGAAFGLLRGHQGLFLVVASVVILLLVFYSSRLRKKQFLLATGMGLLLGGTLGNLYDRMILQYVVDFIDFRVWPVFNVADMLIDVGVGLILYDTFFLCKRTQDDSSHSSPGGGQPPA